MTQWQIFKGQKKPTEKEITWPQDPPWRIFQNLHQQQDQESLEIKRLEQIGSKYISSEHEQEMVNAAIHLKRPLLITGDPGTGKSSLAYAVAYELKLGPVLYWPVNSKTSLLEGLYQYDAIAHMQAVQADQNNITAVTVENFIKLGPLGMAFADSKEHPRVLLIDEIDKSDIDLPNDLLHIFERGEFEIIELMRKENQKTFAIYPPYGNKKIEVKPKIQCHHFPLIFLTSNGEREFPAPFLRRCLRLDLKVPGEKKLAKIIASYFQIDPKAINEKTNNLFSELIADFSNALKDEENQVAVDQLLNAIQLIIYHYDDLNTQTDLKEFLQKAILRALNEDI